MIGNGALSTVHLSQRGQRSSQRTGQESDVIAIALICLRNMSGGCGQQLPETARDVAFQSSAWAPEMSPSGKGGGE